MNISKIVFCNYSKTQSRNLYTTKLSLLEQKSRLSTCSFSVFDRSSSIPGCDLIRCIIQSHTAVYNHIVSKRFTSSNKIENNSNQETENKEESNYNDAYSSSSSYSYRKQNRESYEQKKSQYEKNKTSSEGLTKTNGIEQKNHYERLNIDCEADQDAIKTAYYSLSKIYHPDIVGSSDPNNSDNFRLLTESYDVLSNSASRAIYDRELNASKRLQTNVNFDNLRHPHKDFNLIYRTRDSDMIFRARQEAALQREKLLNPRKFRAGVFESSSIGQVSNSATDLHKLTQQINSISSRNTFSEDGSEFYKMHMYDSLRRKHADLVNHEYIGNSNSNSKSRSPDDGIVPGILTVLVIFGALTLYFINVLVDLDIPHALDVKLEEFIKNKTNKDK